jgi:hypothetical protein
MTEGADEWECDMAETYGIVDVDSVPLRKLALLSAGLRDDSRIKMKLYGANVSLMTQLTAAMLDKLSWLCWSKTQDAAAGRNRPKSIYKALTKVGERHEQREIVLCSCEEFYKRWNEE